MKLFSDSVIFGSIVLSFLSFVVGHIENRTIIFWVGVFGGLCVALINKALN